MTMSEEEKAEKAKMTKALFEAKLQILESIKTASTPGSEDYLAGEARMLAEAYALLEAPRRGPGKGGNAVGF